MPEIERLDLLRDLAVVMVVAGGVILIFHWLRQPVILGYIVAGVIIGALHSTLSTGQ
jgi:CPA2 family monovalent cation:H+ antiporter-2